VRISGIDNIILTKLDVLTGLRTIKVCVSYRRGGAVLDDLPALVHEYEGLEPQYVELEGWDCDLEQVRRWEDLPASLHTFVREVSKLVECPISFVSVGPGREATIPVDVHPVVAGFVSSK
jgi:adenylosuccinate synthase